MKYCKKKYNKNVEVIIGSKEEVSYATQNISKDITKMRIANLKITIKLSPCHTKSHLMFYMKPLKSN